MLKVTYPPESSISPFWSSINDKVAQKFFFLSGIFYLTFTVTQGKEHPNRNSYSFLDSLFRIVIVSGSQRVFDIGSMSIFLFRAVNSIKSVIMAISFTTDYY